MSSYLSRPRSVEQAKEEAREAFAPPIAVVNKALDYFGRPQQGLYASLLEDQSVVNAFAGNTDLDWEDVRKGNYYADQVSKGMESAIFEPLGIKPAFNVLMDVYADPANIPTASALKSLPTLGNNLGESYATLATGLENFIDGFYGGDRAGSMAKWARSQVKNLISPFSQKSVQIMKATGLTKPVIDILAKHVASLKPGSTNKATRRKIAAQMEHAGYTMHRAGIPTEELPTVIQSIIKGMSVKGTGFQPESFDNYWETVGDIPRRFVNKAGDRKGNNFKVDKNVAETLYNQAKESMVFKGTDKMPTDIIVRSSDYYLGDFQTDVFKSGVARAAAGFFQKNKDSSGKWAFIKGKKTMEGAEELAEGLKDFLVDYGPFKNKQQKIATSGKENKEGIWEIDGIRTGDDGVYITYSGRTANDVRTAGIISGSFLEGGVNMQVHINKDGIMTSLISDKYDFLEKQLPTEALFKNEIFGVSLPIVVDLKAVGSGKQYRNTGTGVDIEDSTKQAIGLIEQAREASSFKNAPVSNLTDMASTAVGGAMGGGMLVGALDAGSEPQERPEIPTFRSF